jgi:tritrans,polycis-undecaprenyl-diphosphate synthase [geranylgeranyl-diphosphate specific]
MENILKIPQHIAIIPDGNRRWAQKRLLSPWLGHKKGSEILNDLVDVVIELQVPYVTFWGSSKDNMVKRSREEVKCLLSLFKEQFSELADNEKVHKNEMRINIIGAWREQFPDDVKESMERAIENTKKYSKHFMNFLIAYSGTDEVLEAVRKMADDKKAGQEISREMIKRYLLTKDLPSVDLVVRTGGEPHNSDGFMMWDTANSQYVFFEKLWPDFTKEDLRSAISEYSRRERRLGQ